MSGAPTEPVVEQVVLGRLEAVGWRIARGPDTAPPMPGTERWENRPTAGRDVSRLDRRKMVLTLKESIRRYSNRAFETAQVIKELIALARQMREASARGDQPEGRANPGRCATQPGLCPLHLQRPVGL